MGTAILAIAGTATAAELATAKLAAPVAKKEKVVAGGAVFTCESTDCVSGSASDRGVSMEVCKALSRRFGKVLSLSDGRRTLPPEKLEACNAGAPAR